MTAKTEGSLEFDSLHVNSRKNTNNFLKYISIDKLKSY